MARVVHFELHAADPERAMRFYESVFDWRFSKMPGEGVAYWLISTGEGDGINGGLLPRQGPPPSDGQPVNAYTCTLAVDDIDASMKAGVEAGGSVALPRMTIPGVGYVGYLKDTEGNIFGLHQADHDAK
ncbi:VOC family protein [Terricaulis silvestris]|uniref:Putative enzyme related to lactoylglutathione lyase n=1 Tax=Terricaulis silvestris TaxID=2686094 RepID=A0A6I6MIN4_9CAUL|nr:VOC family protein [Terricaulis silvestris]QGZ94409.1 putative enzyme related to lactoylglutathione lyase [Terricaulis silvestris]